MHVESNKPQLLLKRSREVLDSSEPEEMGISTSYPLQWKTRTNKQLANLSKNMNRCEAAGNYLDAICNWWRYYNKNCNHFK